MTNILNLSSDDNLDLGELLSLHGCVIEQSYGCRVKIEAQLCNKRFAGRPHGIRYSLSLHAPGGQRILGYDNAHPIKKRQGRHAVTKYASYDHKHKQGTNTGEPYHFTSAQQLMADFWEDVNNAIEQYMETRK
jgi:hypothetical protein